MSEFSESVGECLLESQTARLHEVFKVVSSLDNIDPYKQYRIVQVAEDEFEIHQVCYEGCFGLPKFIGGNGLFHWRFFWEHGSDFTRSREVRPTYEAAKVVIEVTLAHHKRRLAEVKKKKVWKIMGVYNAEV